MSQPHSFSFVSTQAARAARDAPPARSRRENQQRRATSQECEARGSSIDSNPSHERRRGRHERERSRSRDRPRERARSPAKDKTRPRRSSSRSPLKVRSKTQRNSPTNNKAPAKERGKARRPASPPEGRNKARRSTSPTKERGRAKRSASPIKERGRTRRSPTPDNERSKPGGAVSPAKEGARSRRVDPLPTKDRSKARRSASPTRKKAKSQHSSNPSPPPSSRGLSPGELLDSSEDEGKRAWPRRSPQRRCTPPGGRTRRGRSPRCAHQRWPANPGAQRWNPVARSPPRPEPPFAHTAREEHSTDPWRYNPKYPPIPPLMHRPIPPPPPPPPLPRFPKIRHTRVQLATKKYRLHAQTRRLEQELQHARQETRQVQTAMVGLTAEVHQKTSAHKQEQRDHTVTRSALAGLQRVIAALHTQTYIALSQAGVVPPKTREPTGDASAGHLSNIQLAVSTLTSLYNAAQGTIQEQLSVIHQQCAQLTALRKAQREWRARTPPPPPHPKQTKRKKHPKDKPRAPDVAPDPVPAPIQLRISNKSCVSIPGADQEGSVSVGPAPPMYSPLITPGSANISNADIVVIDIEADNSFDDEEEGRGNHRSHPIPFTPHTPADEVDCCVSTTRCGAVKPLPPHQAFQKPPTPRWPEDGHDADAPSCALSKSSLVCYSPSPPCSDTLTQLLTCSYETPPHAGKSGTPSPPSHPVSPQPGTRWREVCFPLWDASAEPSVNTLPKRPVCTSPPQHSNSGSRHASTHSSSSASTPPSSRSSRDSLSSPQGECEQAQHAQHSVTPERSPAYSPSRASCVGKSGGSSGAGSATRPYNSPPTGRIHTRFTPKSCSSSSSSRAESGRTTTSPVGGGRGQLLSSPAPGRGTPPSGGTSGQSSSKSRSPSSSSCTGSERASPPPLGGRREQSSKKRPTSSSGSSRASTRRHPTPPLRGSRERSGSSSGSSRASTRRHLTSPLRGSRERSGSGSGSSRASTRRRPTSPLRGSRVRSMSGSSRRCATSPLGGSRRRSGRAESRRSSPSPPGAVRSRSVSSSGSSRAESNRSSASPLGGGRGRSRSSSGSSRAESRRSSASPHRMVCERSRSSSGSSRAKSIRSSTSPHRGVRERSRSGSSRAESLRSSGSPLGGSYEKPASSTSPLRINPRSSNTNSRSVECLASSNKMQPGGSWAPCTTSIHHPTTHPSGGFRELSHRTNQSSCSARPPTPPNESPLSSGAPSVESGGAAASPIGGARERPSPPLSSGAPSVESGGAAASPIGGARERPSPPLSSGAPSVESGGAAASPIGGARERPSSPKKSPLSSGAPSVESGGAAASPIGGARERPSSPKESPLSSGAPSGACEASLVKPHHETSASPPHGRALNPTLSSLCGNADPQTPVTGDEVQQRSIERKPGPYTPPRGGSERAPGELLTPKSPPVGRHSRAPVQPSPGSFASFAHSNNNTGDEGSASEGTTEPAQRRCLDSQNTPTSPHARTPVAASCERVALQVRPTTSQRPPGDECVGTPSTVLSIASTPRDASQRDTLSPLASSLGCGYSGAPPASTGSQRTLGNVGITPLKSHPANESAEPVGHPAPHATEQQGFGPLASSYCLGINTNSSPCPPPRAATPVFSGTGAVSPPQTAPPTEPPHTLYTVIPGICDGSTVDPSAYCVQSPVDRNEYTVTRSAPPPLCDTASPAVSQWYSNTPPQPPTAPQPSTYTCSHMRSGLCAACEITSLSQNYHWGTGSANPAQGHTQPVSQQASDAVWDQVMGIIGDDTCTTASTCPPTTSCMLGAALCTLRDDPPYPTQSEPQYTQLYGQAEHRAPNTAAYTDPFAAPQSAAPSFPQPAPQSAAPPYPQPGPTFPTFPTFCPQRSASHPTVCPQTQPPPYQAAIVNNMVYTIKPPCVPMIRLHSHLEQPLSYGFTNSLSGAGTLPYNPTAPCSAPAPARGRRARLSRHSLPPFSSLRITPTPTRAPAPQFPEPPTPTRSCAPPPPRAPTPPPASEARSQLTPQMEQCTAAGQRPPLREEMAAAAGILMLCDDRPGVPWVGTPSPASNHSVELSPAPNVDVCVVSTSSHSPPEHPFNSDLITAAEQTEGQAATCTSPLVQIVHTLNSTCRSTPPRASTPPVSAPSTPPCPAQAPPWPPQSDPFATLEQSLLSLQTTPTPPRTAPPLESPGGTSEESALSSSSSDSDSDSSSSTSTHHSGVLFGPRSADAAWVADMERTAGRALNRPASPNGHTDARATFWARRAVRGQLPTGEFLSYLLSVEPHPIIPRAPNPSPAAIARLLTSAAVHGTSSTDVYSVEGRRFYAPRDVPHDCTDTAQYVMRVTADPPCAVLLMPDTSPTPSAPQPSPHPVESTEPTSTPHPAQTANAPAAQGASPSRPVPPPPGRKRTKRPLFPPPAKVPRFEQSPNTELPVGGPGAKGVGASSRPPRSSSEEEFGETRSRVARQKTPSPPSGAGAGPSPATTPDKLKAQCCVLLSPIPDKPRAGPGPPKRKKPAPLSLEQLTTGLSALVQPQRAPPRPLLGYKIPRLNKPQSSHQAPPPKRGVKPPLTHSPAVKPPTPHPDTGGKCPRVHVKHPVSGGKPMSALRRTNPQPGSSKTVGTVPATDACPTRRARRRHEDPPAQDPTTHDGTVLTATHLLAIHCQVKHCYSKGKSQKTYDPSAWRTAAANHKYLYLHAHTPYMRFAANNFEKQTPRACDLIDASHEHHYRTGSIDKHKINMVQQYMQESQNAFGLSLYMTYHMLAPAQTVPHHACARTCIFMSRPLQWFKQTVPQRLLGNSNYLTDPIRGVQWRVIWGRMVQLVAPFDVVARAAIALDPHGNTGYRQIYKKDGSFPVRVLLQYMALNLPELITPPANIPPHQCIYCTLSNEEGSPPCTHLCLFCEQTHMGNSYVTCESHVSMGAQCFPLWLFLRFTVRYIYFLSQRSTSLPTPRTLENLMVKTNKNLLEPNQRPFNATDFEVSWSGHKYTPLTSEAHHPECTMYHRINEYNGPCGSPTTYYARCREEFDRGRCPIPTASSAPSPPSPPPNHHVAKLVQLYTASPPRHRNTRPRGKKPPRISFDSGEDSDNPNSPSPATTSTGARAATPHKPPLRGGAGAPPWAAGRGNHSQGQSTGGRHAEQGEGANDTPLSGAPSRHTSEASSEGSDEDYKPPALRWRDR
ncbi:ORF13 [Ranid herpesvirus 1]|uniref:ORF13 n=1 Tax=Ranid herpesvirus 1 TaxID=85655 RepID=Q14VU5_9VIRU|nr:ORF13 [Ranid herpesvirus 1]ABG25707.1 ORF13 [Ranid herpesvirus 1]